MRRPSGESTGARTEAAPVVRRVIAASSSLPSDLKGTSQRASGAAMAEKAISPPGLKRGCWWPWVVKVRRTGLAVSAPTDKHQLRAGPVVIEPSVLEDSGARGDDAGFAAGGVDAPDLMAQIDPIG